MANYTKWYRVGDVSLVKNSTALTGKNTYWLSAGLNPGDLFTLDASQFYEVDSIVDNTHITLRTAYAGASVSEVDYSIIRNFTSSMQADIAARTADLVNDMRKYIDTDMQSIHGKSAYEIAKDHGYTGTEAQWLNYLIGAGQWQELKSQTEAKLSAQDSSIASSISSQNSRITAAENTVSSMNSTVTTLNTRTTVFANKSGYMRNYIYKYSETSAGFTTAQLNAIKAGNNNDIYPGFRWLGIPGIVGGASVAHLNYYNNGSNKIDGGEGTAYHAVCVARIGSPAYNTTGADVNPRYTTSTWFTEFRPTLIEKLEAFFGAENLRSWTATELLYSDSTHECTGVASFTGKCELMTLPQATGFPLAVNGKVIHKNTKENQQLALCKMEPTCYTAMCRDAALYSGGKWYYANAYYPNYIEYKQLTVGPLGPTHVIFVLG